MSGARENDAVWARFYRDGKDLGEIAAEFGGSIYTYSPWLYAPYTRGLPGDVAKAEVLSERVAALEAALKRTDEHMRSFAEYHPDECTSETDAIIWCNRELLQ